MVDFLPGLRRGRRQGQQVVLADGKVAAYGSTQEVKQLTWGGYFSGVTANPAGLSGKAWTWNRAILEAYGRVVWVYRSVEVLAGVYSRLPIAVAEIGTLGDDREPTLHLDDPLLPLLSRWGKANSLENGMQYRHRKAQQKLLSPRGTFTEVTLSRGGTPLSLMLLPPGRTRIVAAKDGSIDHYEVDPARAGDKVRRVEPDVVIWDREPHPDNPYAGMTPLEAAGLTIEMDHFAKLFNRQWLANDDGVSKVVGIAPSDEDSGELSEEEARRIEKQLGLNQGVLGAGRSVVVDGKVTLADIGKTPKDLSYKELREAGKEEILSAYYVPESKIGNASGRTFANAGQEDLNWWAERMMPFADGCAGVYSVLTDDGLCTIPDYRGVEAVRQLKAVRREEMRAEVTAGLRTPLSYAERTGQLDADAAGAFPDVPGTRALWVTGGVPIAATPEEQVDVDKLTSIGSGAAAAPARAGAAGPGGQGRSTEPTVPPGSGEAPGGDAGTPAPGSPGFKAAPRAHHTKAGPAPSGDDDEEDDRGPLDTALEQALSTLADRQVDRAIAKLRGTKARRDTAFWSPPGRKALDPASLADPDAWAQQAMDVAGPILAQGAARSAVQVMDQLAQQGVELDPDELPPPEDDGLEHPLVDLIAAALATIVATLPETVPAAAAPILAYHAGKGAYEAAKVIAEAAAARAHRVQDAVREAATTATAAARAGQVAMTQPLADAIRAAAGDSLAWAKRNATSAVTSAVESARVTVLNAAGDRIERVWRTRRDDKVRPTHRAVEGQVRRGSAPFDVDGEQLRFPGDPNVRPDLWINCRCRVSYRIRKRYGLKDIRSAVSVTEAKTIVEWDPAKHPRGFHGRFGHVVKTEAEGLSDALDVHHAPTAGPESMTVEELHGRTRKGEKLAGRTVTLTGATSGEPYDVTLTREPQVHPDGIVLNFHRGYDEQGELRVGQRKLEPDEVVQLHPVKPPWHDRTMTVEYLHSIAMPNQLDVTRPKLVAMSADIAEHGVRVPLQVEQTRSGDILTDGHHRLLAAEAAGLTDLPVRVYDNTPEGRSAANRAIAGMDAPAGIAPVDVHNGREDWWKRPEQVEPGRPDLRLPATIKRRKAHVKAVQAALDAMPFGPGNTRDDREHDSEVIRLEGLIALNREEQALYQRAIDRNEVPPEWLDNPREGVPLGSTDAYGGQHMTRERAQEAVDDRQTTIDRLQAKLDDYEAYRAKHGGWSNMTGLSPSLLYPHLQAVRKAGKALDAEAQRRFEQAVAAAGLDDQDKRLEELRVAYSQATHAFGDVVADLWRQGRDAGLEVSIADAREHAREIHPDLAAAFDKAEADVDAFRESMLRRRDIEDGLRAMAFREVLADVRPMGRGDKGTSYQLGSQVTPGYHRRLIEDVKVGNRLKVGDVDREVTEVYLDPTSTGAHGIYYVHTVNPNDVNDATALRISGSAHADVKVGLNDDGSTWVDDAERTALASLQRAEAFYPTAWHDAADGRTLTVLDARRGFFAAERDMIVLSQVGAKGNVNDDHTAVHELGHYFEDTLPGVRVLEYALYLARTTKGKPDQHGNWPDQEAEQELPGLPGEKARFDKFPERYTGKTYKTTAGWENSPSGSYELLTTVAESLFAGSAYDDADLRATILGILATV